MANFVKSKLAVNVQQTSRRFAGNNSLGFKTTSPEVHKEYNLPGESSGIPTPVFSGILFPLGKFDLQKGKLRWGGQWVDHRHQFKRLIAHGPPYYDYWAILCARDYSDAEKAELIRFLLTLELWETTPGNKIMTAEQVWIKSLTLGPAYAETLSDEFSLTWRENDPESYNFAYPARFLPRWNEAVDDLSLTKIATYSNPDVLEEFSYTLDLLLKEVKDIDDNIELPRDEQILFERSTTTSYIHSLGRKLPHWEASFLVDGFNTKELIGLREVVPVYPSGFRDTIIADKTANNSIRWIERALRHILQYVPESAVTLRSSTFRRRLDDVVYTRGSHILRDIKKCGLTYNVRDLFPRVEEALNDHFPDIRWNRLKIFQNMRIIDTDTEYTAVRGYGLGMANHLVTLCNIVIHRMARNALATKPHPFKMKAIVGNDDEDVVIYNTPHHRRLANEYLELEHDIHGALGNLTNFKKSVIKPYGLFYETYNRPGWEHKEALVCNAIACAYLAPNIRVAKHYIFSQSDRFTSLWARRRLRALAAYWGGEFFSFEEELVIHFEAGGWLDTRSTGLKTTLVDLERLSKKHNIRLISYAVETCRQFMKPPSPHWSEREEVSNHVYLGQSKKTDPKIQTYFLGEKDLKMYYRKLTSYQRNYSNRLSNYENRILFKKIYNNLEDIQGSLMKREPWYTIPENLVQQETIWLNSLKLTSDLEVSRWSDDPLNDIILYSKGLKDESEVEDLNIHWDPVIPVEAQDYEVYCDLPQLLSGSQFSNGGFLPLLEYYSRNETLPICKFIGRLRIPPPPMIRDKFSSLLSRFTRKHEKKKPHGEILQEDLPDAKTHQQEIDELKALGYDGSKLKESLNEFPAYTKLLTRTDEEKRQADERLSRLAEGLSDRLGMSSYIKEYFGDREIPDILDEDSDSEGGMFSMFD